MKLKIKYDPTWAFKYIVIDENGCVVDYFTTIKKAKKFIFKTTLQYSEVEEYNKIH